MMIRKLIVVGAAVALTAVSYVAFAANGSFTARTYQLPQLKCTRSKCTLVQRPEQSQPRRQTLMAAPFDSAPAAPDTTPVEVGPPAGQRYMFYGPGYATGDCQSIIGVTGANPYEYIKGTQIVVPLGSTHISLLATLEANLSGGPSGSGADVGILEVKRSSSASGWYIVNAGYAYTIYGSEAPQSLFNVATYHGLVNLADLGDGTGVPSEIDVRVIVFPVNTSGFSNVNYNMVCAGQLQLSF